MLKKYQRIIAAWRRYIDIEKLCNIQIDASELSDGQIITLKRDLIKENSSDIGLNINEKLFQYFMNERNNSLKTKVVIGLAPIEVTFNRQSKYIPLFVFSIQKTFEELLSTPINMSHGSEEIFPVLDVSFHAGSDYFISAVAFKEYFGVDPESIPKNLPLATLINDLSGGTNLWFEEIIEDFTNWAEDAMLGNRKYRKMSRRDGFILNDYDNSSSQLIDEQLEKLIAQEYAPAEATAAHSYLFGNNCGDTNKYNQQDDTLWKGSFHPYPIAKGQATVIQKIKKQEKAIACQGAPGTGKTTLLMAVIAGTITMRAQALMNGEDTNSLMLIVSTANKAVQNAARELEGTDEFNTNNSFYFIGGKKENQEKSFGRVSKYKEWLSVQVYDSKYHAKIEQKIIHLHKILDARQSCYKQKLSELKQANSKYEIFTNEHQNLETRLDIASAVHVDLGNTLVSFSIDNENSQSSLDKFNRWKRDVGASRYFKTSSFKEIEKFNSIHHDNLVAEITTCCLAIEEVNFIIDFFTKKKQNTAKAFAIINRELLAVFSIDWQSINEHSILKAMTNIDKIINEADSLLAGKPNPFFFEDLNIDPVNILTKFIDTFKEKVSLLEQIETKKALIEVIAFAEDAIAKYGDFIDVFRIKTFRTNRRIYRLSKEYIELEAIKQKNTLVKVLSLWQDISLGYGYKQKNAISAVIGMGTDKYFKLISMAYPIHTSSIHASPGIFKPFFQKSSDSLKGFKPIYILFSDESGMSLPHLAYPAIYQSEYVVAVGDPKQLPPVVTIDPTTGTHFENEYYTDESERGRYSPTRTSLYHRAAKCDSGHFDDIGDGVILDEHRRCQPAIANLFVDIAEYSGMEVCTSKMSDEDMEKLGRIGGRNLLFYDVPGISGKQRNTNIDEVFAISSIVSKLEECGYDIKKDIGIITPYAAQEGLIIKELGDRLGHTADASKIGTVHKFQGVEFNVVIFSPVIHKETDSALFINGSPNLLNVAVSRAKHLFVVAGNFDKLASSDGYLSKICTHCKHLGYVVSIGHQYDQRKPEVIIAQNETNLLNSCEHIEWFLTNIASAKKHIVISSPWITIKNLAFSLPPLKAAILRGVVIDIFYGYQKDDFGDVEAVEQLSEIGCNLILKPEHTHSKVIIIDEEIMCVGSFNWLSQSHHWYCRENYFQKVNIRNEISLWINNPAQAKETISLLRGKIIVDKAVNSPKLVNNDETLLCSRCSSKINENVYLFSMKKFSEPVCYSCQKK